MVYPYTPQTDTHLHTHIQTDKSTHIAAGAAYKMQYHQIALQTDARDKHRWIIFVSVLNSACLYRFLERETNKRRCFKERTTHSFEACELHLLADCGPMSERVSE